MRQSSDQNTGIMRRALVWAAMIACVVLGAVTQAQNPLEFGIPKAQLTDIDILFLDPSDPDAQRVQAHLRGSDGETLEGNRVEVKEARFLIYDLAAAANEDGSQPALLLMDAPRLLVDLNTWEITAGGPDGTRPVTLFLRPGPAAMTAFRSAHFLNGQEGAEAKLETDSMRLRIESGDALGAEGIAAKINQGEAESAQGQPNAGKLLGERLQSGFSLVLDQLKNVRFAALGSTYRAQTMEIRADFPQGLGEEKEGMQITWPERLIVSSPAGLRLRLSAAGLDWNAPAGALHRRNTMHNRVGDPVAPADYELSCLGASEFSYRVNADTTAAAAGDEPKSISLTFSMLGNVAIGRLGAQPDAEQQSSLIDNDTLLRAETLEIQGRVRSLRAGEERQPEFSASLRFGDSLLRVDRLLAQGDVRAAYAGASARGNQLEVSSREREGVDGEELVPFNPAKAEDGQLEVERRFVLTGNPLLEVAHPTPREDSFDGMKASLLECDAREWIVLSESRFENATRYGLQAKQLATCDANLAGGSMVRFSGESLDIRLRITPEDEALLAKLRQEQTGSGLAAINPRSVETVRADGSYVTPRMEYFEVLTRDEIVQEVGLQRVLEERVPKSVLYRRRLAIFGESMVAAANDLKLLQLESSGKGVRVTIACPQAFLAPAATSRQQVRQSAYTDTPIAAKLELSTSGDLRLATDFLLQAQLAALERAGESAASLPADVIPGATWFDIDTFQSSILEELPQRGIKSALECGACSLRVQLKHEENEAGELAVQPALIPFADAQVTLDSAELLAERGEAGVVRAALGYDFLEADQLNVYWTSKRHVLSCAGPTVLTLRSPALVDALGEGASFSRVILRGEPEEAEAMPTGLEADTMLLTTSGRLNQVTSYAGPTIQQSFELAGAVRMDALFYQHPPRLSGNEARREWDLVSKFDHLRAWSLTGENCNMNLLMRSDAPRQDRANSSAWQVQSFDFSLNGPARYELDQLNTFITAGAIKVKRSLELLGDLRSSFVLSGPVEFEAKTKAVFALLETLELATKGGGGAPQLLSVYPRGANVSTSGELSVVMVEPRSEQRAQVAFSFPEPFTLTGRREDGSVHRVKAGRLVSRFVLSPEILLSRGGEAPWFAGVEELRADGGIAMRGDGVVAEGEGLYFDAERKVFTLAGESLKLGFRDAATIHGVQQIEFAPGLRNVQGNARGAEESGVSVDGASGGLTDSSQPQLEFRGKERIKIRINTLRKGEAPAQPEPPKRKIEERGEGRND